ncbi:nucleotidyltransferase domain-containing protein [Nanoarchaeota archaeon]
MDNENLIISYLGKNIGKSFTMHELSKLLRIPYASFYRTVQRMEDILLIQKVGKSKTLRLNWDNPAIKAYLTIASHEEKKEYLQAHPIIRKIASEIDTKDIVLLFGSYAKGTENEKSDIDILVINKDGKKALSFSKHEMLYRKKINPVFITKRELKNMLRAKEENIGKQALENHIILNNAEGYWGCVLDVR